LGTSFADDEDATAVEKESLRWLKDELMCDVTINSERRAHAEAIA
jgi:hypothetical protein